MRKADIVSSAIVTLFGVLLILVIIPVFVPTILDGDYGLRAKDMPNVAAIAITGMAVAFFVYRYRSPPAADETDEEPPMLSANWRFLGGAAVFLLFVTALFTWLGFLYAAPVTIVGFIVLMGERRWWAVVVAAVSAPVFIWLFFWQLLRFPLP